MKQKPDSPQRLGGLARQARLREANAERDRTIYERSLYERAEDLAAEFGLGRSRVFDIIARERKRAKRAGRSAA